jgi:hypothetical protein
MKNGVVGLARLAIVAFLVLVVGSPIGAVAQSTIVALDENAARERSHEQLAARAASLDLDLATPARPAARVSPTASGGSSRTSMRVARAAMCSACPARSSASRRSSSSVRRSASRSPAVCRAPMTSISPSGSWGSAAGLVSLGLLGGAVVVHTEASDALSNWRDRVVFARVFRDGEC